MDITANTPRRDRKIADIIVKVPAPYTTGHVVTEAEASILNQTLAENISNNLRDKFTIAAVAATETSIAVPERKLTDVEAQALVDEYVTGYTPGVRGAGTSAPRVTDPVEKEARVMATEKVLSVLKARSMLRKNVANFDELVETAFEKRKDEYMAAAKKIVKARETAAAGLAGASTQDDDLGEIKAKEAAAPAA